MNQKKNHDKIDDDSEDKKAKGRKKCIIKRKLEFETFEIHKNCLELRIK